MPNFLHSLNSQQQPPIVASVPSDAQPEQVRGSGLPSSSLWRSTALCGLEVYILRLLATITVVLRCYRAFYGRRGALLQSVAARSAVP